MLLRRWSLKAKLREGHRAMKKPFRKGSLAA